MTIHPEDLIAAVRAMTVAQRTRFCLMLDPIRPTPDDLMGPQGPQGPPGPQGDQGVHSGAQGAEVRLPNFMMHDPAPELLAQLLYKQLTGKRLDVPAPGRSVRENVRAMRQLVPAGAPDSPNVPFHPEVEAIVGPHASRDVVIRPLYGQVGLLARLASVEASQPWRRLADGAVFDVGVDYALDGSQAPFTPPAGCMPHGPMRVHVTLTDVVGPGPVFGAFARQYGDVTKAAANHLHIARRGSIGALEVRNCVLTTLGPTAEGGGLAHAAGMALVATAVYREPTCNRPPVTTEFAPPDEALTLGDAMDMATAEDAALDAAIEADGRDNWEAALGPRWARARARWERLFGDRHIPMVRTPADRERDIEWIEGMLYDKETKNIDPPTCPCGCGNVIGCGIP